MSCLFQFLERLWFW